MSRHQRKAKLKRASAGKSAATLPAEPPAELYRRACSLAAEGHYDEARQVYRRLKDAAGADVDNRLRALIRNDLAVLAALESRFDEAKSGWQAAMEADPACLLAKLNRDLMVGELERVSASASEVPAPLQFAPAPTPMQPASNGPVNGMAHTPGNRTKVAIVSFLFNWPSTGGGNMHTAGLADFLGRAGYDVRHYYCRYPAWGLGGVAAPLPYESEALEFAQADWNVRAIQSRYRAAVDQFQPDHVVITDAWNMKPVLADAMRGYPTFLMMQAQETLCPLNNLRLLADGPDRVWQCPRNQLATPEVCHRCVIERGYHSGPLHRFERELAGVGTAEYDEMLRRSLQKAEAVLVLNPLTAAMMEPYAKRVCVVPWGLDPARFPWAGGAAERSLDHNNDGIKTLFMAAVAGEFIKGFHIAHEACRLLRQTRADFELVVTFDPPGPGRMDEFTRSVGWCSQAELPEHYRAADICLVPTIAQDALSLTSVEAMASGIPVVASRIGGLPYTVAEGVTGLLFEPGDPADLAQKIGRLLDDSELRRQMGLAGRARFEEEFRWETVIDRYWRPLLGRRAASRGNSDF